jgi:DNA-directed RNA polymerase subunit M/transcription elongation factor TFIIS
MWKYKGCPRCQGDIFIDEDIDESYEKCLQCGYERELLGVRRSKRARDTEKDRAGVC